MLGAEAESGHQLAGAGAGTVAADGVEMGVQFRLACTIVGGLGGVQIAFNLTQFGIAIEDEFQRRIGQGRGFLGDMGDDPARWQVDIAGVRVQFVAQQGEQGGFATAVGTDHPDLPAGMHGERAVVEQRLAAALQGELAKADQTGRVLGEGLENRLIVRPEHRLQGSTVQRLPGAGLRWAGRICWPDGSLHP